MANLLGYDIAEPITQNQVQQMMVKIMHNSDDMKAILGCEENSDVADLQLRISVLQVFSQQLQDDSSGLSTEALALFSTEVARLTKVFSPGESPHGFHKGHTHSCPCSDFTSALAAQNNPRF